MTFWISLVEPLCIYIIKRLGDIINEYDLCIYSETFKIFWHSDWREAANTNVAFNTH